MLRTAPRASTSSKRARTEASAPAVYARRLRLAIRANDAPSVHDSVAALEASGVGMETLVREGRVRAVWLHHDAAAIALLDYRTPVSPRCDPLLALALREGRAHVVRRLLEKGARVEFATFLTVVGGGSLELVRTLLDHDERLLTQRNLNSTPVGAAVRHHRGDVMRLLVERGGDIHGPDRCGFSPIHTAIDHGREDLARALVEFGANTAAPSRGQSLTPAYLAAKRGRVDMLQMVAERGADVETPTARGFRPMHAAAGRGHDDAVRWLARQGASVTAATLAGLTPVYLASEHGHVGTVSLLVALGADVATPSAKGHAPIYAAAEQGRVEVVELLAWLGADVEVPDHDGFQPLHAAAKRGFVDTARWLVATGAHAATPSVEGYTPLYLAAESGHLAMVQFLALSHPASMETAERRGFTPIYVAAEHGHVDVVRWLVEQGANADTFSRGGRFSPLFIAAETGQLGVAQCLLDRGADASVADVWGRTPIYIASDRGHSDMVRLLAESGSSVLAPCTTGLSPISAAASKGRTAALCQLLEAGASANGAGPGRDKSPLAHALDGAHWETAAALIWRNARVAGAASRRSVRASPRMRRALVRWADETLARHDTFVYTFLRGAADRRTQLSRIGSVDDILRHIAVLANVPFGPTLRNVREARREFELRQGRTRSRGHHDRLERRDPHHRR